MIAKKAWSEVSDFLDVEGVGNIENNTVFFIRLIDAAGNISLLPTTQTPYLIATTDDEAPKMESYLKLSAMQTNGDKGILSLKYDVPDSVAEGDYVEVFVYGYSDSIIKTEPVQQLGYIKLFKTNGYAAGIGGTTGSPLVINFAQHPEVGIVPDANKVFIRMRDSRGNVTTKANEKDLNTLIGLNPLNP